MLLFALPSAVRAERRREPREFVIRSEVQPPADQIRSATPTAARLLPDRNLKLIMKEGRVYWNELGASR
jgi:hypothetical protein